MKLFSAAWILLLYTTTAAWAVDFDYIKIADQTTQAPTVGGTFTEFDAPVADGSNLAFRASRMGYAAVVSTKSGSLARIVDTATSIPGTSGELFNSVFSPSVSGASVAVAGFGMSTNGVYRADNGILSRVADNNTTVPLTGTLGGFSNTAINGSKVMFGVSSPSNGVYIGGPTGITRVANTSTLAPPENSNPYSTFAQISAAGDTYAFAASSMGGNGIYAYDGNTLREVARTGRTLPNSAETYQFLYAPSVSNGSIAFRNSGMSSSGIYLDVGGTVSRMVDTTMPVPDGGGNFSAFSGLSLDDGNVAFLGYYNLSSSTGVFVNLGGSLSTVAKQGMILDGGVVQDFPADLSSQALSDGNVAFSVRFSDNRRAVYAAMSNYVYTADASGTWDDGGNWSMGQKPRAVVGTVIRPSTGALVLGPATSTTLHTLELDTTNTGVAELRLQPTGQLTVNEYAYVQTRGKLNLNGGVITSQFGMYNYGEVDLAGGQTNGGFLLNRGVLHGSGTVGNFVINFGRIEAINSQQRYQASVDNSVILDINDQPVAIGEIDIRNSLVDFAGGLQNRGQVNISSGASDVFGSVQNLAASAPDPAGQIIVSGNGNVTFYDHVTHDGSLFRVSAGSTATFFGPVSGAGAFTGAGAKIFEGGYSPGNSPAAVALEGSVQFTATNTLKIELGGLNAGTQHDKVNVNGALTLGGKLELSLLAPFQPALGNTFDILDWSTLSGSFTSVQFPALGPNLAWNAMQLYQSGVVSVVDVNLLPGDFNRDHQVTMADISAMLKALVDLAAYQTEKSLTGPQLVAIGDLNLSGSVTNLDLQLLLNIVPTLAGSGSLAAVPEPSSIVLLMLGFSSFGLVLRRRQRRPYGIAV